MPIARRYYLASLGLICFLAACATPKQSREAVEAGVIEYLKGRPGITMDAMDIRITSVSFRGKEADALVSVSAKGATDHANSMQMKYVLEQQGDKWVVKGRSSGSEHGATPVSPVPMEGGATLPPGHPPAGSSGGTKK